MLDDWMQMQQTNPRICHEILAGLQCWNVASIAMEPEKQSEAGWEQDTVRWDLALEGCISS